MTTEKKTTNGTNRIVGSSEHIAFGRAKARPVRIASIGGGPAGLYFALLWKKRHPDDRITVLERNRVDDTFGFGVVFSDATLGNLLEADPDTHREITRAFAHWDDIDVHIHGDVIRSKGHGFSGLSRKTLLQILSRRCASLGVELVHEREVRDFDALRRDFDLVLAADGVNSAVRQAYAREFEPTIDLRPNRFVWLGTTFPFEAFTFYFDENEHGLWRVHAYRYEEGMSTFIVECTAPTFERAGLRVEDEAGTLAYCERLFAPRLRGHRLLVNRSFWRQFPNIENRRWSAGNIVLVGDAAHTAHFSIGSGTKLALEDAIALAGALEAEPDVPRALDAYERGRRPGVEALQRSAAVSLAWFENTERYSRLDSLDFAFSLLTRSLRVTHENLALRDRELVAEVDAAVSRRAGLDRTVPPMFTPFRLREMALENRVVVSPMCQYSATDGTIDDWHLVHLGSRAVGGAGLVMAEMTDVSADGRISPGCAGLYAEAHADAWRRVTAFVHGKTRAKIGIQLGHAGRKGSTKRMWEGMDEPLPHGGWPVLGPSPIPYASESPVPREMDRADMDRVRSDFVRAAELADAAGFDLLELHMAHGYLLATFISPLTNHRTDAYGGSLENRIRFPLEVLDAVRAAWPDAKPISVRISATDWTPGGLTPEDAVGLAIALCAHGADIIDVSAGQTVREQRPTHGRLFQTPFSELIRLEANVPTMTVGNISSYADVNSIIAAGRADLCVLARAHLFDPYWTRHAAYEQGFPMAWPDPYGAMDRYNFRFK
jgi:anthraniloyl-CoA monooxygenase